MNAKIILSILAVFIVTGCGDDQPVQVQQTNFLHSINQASIQVTKINTKYYRKDWYSSEQPVPGGTHQSNSDTIIQQISFTDTVGICGDRVWIVKNNDSVMITCNLDTITGPHWSHTIKNNKSILFILKNSNIESIEYSSEKGESSSDGGQASGTSSSNSFKTSLQIVNPVFKQVNNEYILDISGEEISKYLTKIDSSKSAYSGTYNYPYPFGRNSGEESGVLDILSNSGESNIRIILKP